MHIRRGVLFGYFMTAIVLLVGSVGQAQAAGMTEPTVEYSGDQFMGAEGQIMQSKVYHAPGKQRMEMDQAGAKQVIITRSDRKLSWVLMVDQKMYMEMAQEGAKNQTRDIRECAMTQRAGGRETVNGVSTTRSEVEASCPDGSRYSGSMWTTSEGIMVKLDAVSREGSGKGSRVSIELKNLKIGRQDPSLFEIPAGYTKMAMPSGMGPALGGFDPRGTTKPPSAPQPRSDEPKDTGRAYTAQPRATSTKKEASESEKMQGALNPSPTGAPEADKAGQPDIGQPAEVGRQQQTQPPAGTGALDKALDLGKSLKGLFGR